MTIRIALAAAALALSGAGAFAGDAARPSASTVDAPRGVIGATAADGAAAHGAGTVGAMHFAVAGRAVSIADVRRESRGQLTTAQVRWYPAGKPGV